MLCRQIPWLATQYLPCITAGGDWQYWKCAIHKGKVHGMHFNKVEICGVNTARLPTLTSQEKKALLLQVKAGDSAAREKLIDGNLRLVLSIVQRFTNRRENLDDLFQVGCIGLIKAVDHFNTEIEVEFSTYAVPMVTGCRNAKIE